MSNQLIEFNGSVFVIPSNDPHLCKAFDKDCLELLVNGEHLRCAAGIMAHGILVESEGLCPFIGD